MHTEGGAGRYRLRQNRELQRIAFLICLETVPGSLGKSREAAFEMTFLRKLCGVIAKRDCLRSGLPEGLADEQSNMYDIGCGRRRLTHYQAAMTSEEFAPCERQPSRSASASALAAESESRSRSLGGGGPHLSFSISPSSIAYEHHGHNYTESKPARLSGIDALSDNEGCRVSFTVASETCKPGVPGPTRRTPDHHLSRDFMMATTRDRAKW